MTSLPVPVNTEFVQGPPVETPQTGRASRPTRVFISYAREDKVFVEAIHAALQQLGLDAWVDWEGIPLTADFLQEIYAGIEAADIFMFVVSPDSLASEVCAKEIAHAAENHKRLVPLIHREVDAELVPEPLAKLNWVFFRDTDNFDEALKVLLGAVNTDLDWLHAHTRLLVRALEWQSKGRNNSLLLRGSGLREAEDALTRAAVALEPQITPVQLEFIQASRKAVVRLRRTIYGALTVGFAVALALAATAWFQRNEALQQRDLATSRLLTTQGTALLQTNLDRGLLLLVEATRRSTSLEVSGNLLTGIQASPHLITFLRGHSAGVSGLAYSPDGRILGSGDNDGSIRLWDAGTGEMVGQLNAHQGAVTGLTFSPDGRILASCGRDGTARLWDRDSARMLSQVKLAGAVVSIAFSPDGNTLAAAFNETIGLWNVTTQNAIGQLVDPDGASPNGIAFSPDGRTLAAGGEFGGVTLWDVGGQRVTRRVALPVAQSDNPSAATQFVHSLAFSPNSEVLAVGSFQAVDLIDMENGLSNVQELTGGTGMVESVAFSPDGGTLASGMDDQTVRLWKVADHAPMGLPLAGHTGSIRAVAFSIDGKSVASGSDDGTIGRWAVEPGHPLARSSDPVTALAISPEGRLLASSSGESIQLWDLDGGTAVGEPVPTGSRVETLAFSPKAPLLASANSALLSQPGPAATVRVWDLNGSPTTAPSQPISSAHAAANIRPGSHPLEAVPGDWAAVAFSADGRMLAAGSPPFIRLWDVETGRLIGDPIGNFAQSTGAGAIAFSPDGRILAFASIEKIMLWDTTARRAVGQLTGHSASITSLVFSPDGGLLSSASDDGTIRLWDTTAWKLAVQQLPYRAGPVYSVAFSPDRRFLAAAGEGGSVTLWEAATGQPYGRAFLGHNGAVRSVLFSHDGSMLFTVGMDGTVRQWPVSEPAWEAIACREANRNLTRDEWREYLGTVPYRKTCEDLADPG